MSNSVKTLEISTLYSNLIQTLDQEQFFKVLCKEVRSTLKSDRITASIFSNDGHSTLVYSNKKIGKLNVRKKQLSVESHVTRSQKAYFSNSASRDPMFSDGANDKINSELCFPLVVAESVMGCINLQNCDDKTFSKLDIEQISSIMEEIKTPLENLKIFLSAKELNEVLLSKIEEKESESSVGEQKDVSEKFKINLPEIIGNSQEIKNLLEFSEKVAKQDVNVLISGESGTGKELVAKRIHCLGK